MNLKGIISISGRPGLFKVVAQGKNNVIVESLEDKKRFPAYASDRISALEDISIYGESEDKPIKEIYEAIYEKEGEKEAISHKESADNLKKYLLEIMPEYDQDRVYGSDIKKLFQWYNLLLKAGLIQEKEETDEDESSEVENADTEKPKKKSAAKTDEKSEDKKPAAKKEAKKTTTAKSATAKKASPTKSTAKPSAVKKAPSKTGGTSRGK